jgi:N-formylglutamate deformylase
MQPDAQEIQSRIITYWQPYHDKLQSLIDELLLSHKKIVLFDAHSICSQVPTLFEGQLPDLNIGTADGATIQAELAEQVIAYCKQSPYSMVYNGRFKGGYITRHYGNPARGINAIQLELAQVNYMQETFPFTYHSDKAKNLQQTLSGIISTLITHSL